MFVFEFFVSKKFVSERVVRNSLFLNNYNKFFSFGKFGGKYKKIFRKNIRNISFVHNIRNVFGNNVRLGQVGCLGE